MKTSIIVFDTNTLISAVIRPFSVPHQALNKASSKGLLVYSSETHDELLYVIKKSKFDKYVTEAERQKFIDSYERMALFMPNILNKIIACRDPKDDKFLTLAVAAQADYIISGDADLLVLHPFQGIHIIKPADFLDIIL